MRERRAPHQPHPYRAADTVILLRGDEASAGDGLVDAAGGGTFTDVGSVGVAGSLIASPAGTTGSRTFDGSTQRQSRSSDSAQRTALAAATLTIEAWIRPDVVTGTQWVVSHGASGETEATNYLAALRLIGSEINGFWEYSAGTNVSFTSSGAGLQADVVNHVAMVRTPPVSGTADKCDAFLFVNDEVVHAATDLDMPSGGGSGSWHVAASASATEWYDGAIDDIRVSSFAAGEDCIRDSYGRGIQDWDDDLLYDSGYYAAFSRSLIKDDNGSWQDLSSFYNWDFGQGFDHGDDVDDQGASANVQLRRNVYELSLSPLMAGSLPNTEAGGSVLHLKREVKLQSAVMPFGSSREDAGPYWKTVHHGFITGIDFGREIIDVEVYDLTEELQAQWVEPDRSPHPDPPLDYEYGSVSGTALEGEIEAVITDQTPSAGWRAPDGHALYTPTSPSYNVYQFYTPPTMNCAQQLEGLARDTIGWNLKRKWDDHRKEFRFTLYDPDRSKTWSSGDPIFSPEQVLEVRRLELRRDKIRTAIEVEYGDEADTDHEGTLKRKSYVAEDAAAIAKYGYILGRIGLATADQVNNATAAQNLAERVLSDLSEPKAEFEIDVSYRPYIENGDMVRCEADDLHWDSDQDFAVVKHRHQNTPSGKITTLTLRGGSPVGAVDKWLEEDLVQAGHNDGDGNSPPATPSGLSVTALVGAARLTWDNPVNWLNRRYWETEVHVSTSSSFTADETTIRKMRRGFEASVTDLTPGTTYYFQVIHRDEMGNVSAASSEVSTVPVFTVPKPGFKRIQDSSSTLNLSGWTRFVGNTEEYDNTGNLATSTYTVPPGGAGPHRFPYLLSLRAAGARSTVAVELRDGAGTTTISETHTHTVGTGAALIGGEFEVSLAAGATVEIWVNDTANDVTLIPSQWRGALSTN